MLSSAGSRALTLVDALAQGSPLYVQLGRQRYDWDVEQQPLLEAAASAFERRTRSS